MEDKWKSQNALETENEMLANKLKNYRPELDVYRPKFKDIEDKESRSTNKDFALQWLFLLPLYTFLALTFWGFLEWGKKYPVSYGWFNFGFLMLVIVVFFIAVYFLGGKRKIQEREYIARQFKDYQAYRKAEQDKIERNTNMLRKYLAQTKADKED